MLLKRILTIFYILLTCTSLNFAKSVELPQDIGLAKNQVLGYKIGSTPESLDPGVNVDWPTQNVIKSLFDTLVRQDNRGIIVGAGAESWQASEDGLVWTFKLRKNATWTDGKPVVAQDYIYAWRRVLDPKTASLGADYLSSTNLKNANKIKKGDLPPSSLGVKALDDYTLELTLERPTPWLLETLTFLNTSPVRKDIIEKYGNAWTRVENIVSNGPYKLEEVRFNEVLKFKKREDYWDAKNIYITDINYEVFKDKNASYYQYLAGKFYTAGIPSQFLELVKKERPDEIIAEPYPSTYALIINTKLDKFKDKRVRQALNLLIDRYLTAEKIYKAYYPTSMVAPRILEGAQAQTEDPYIMDRSKKKEREAKARKLLSEAGYSKENPLEIEWLYNKRRDADRNNIGMSYQLQDFSHGLIKIKLKVQDFKTYLSTIQQGNFDVVYYIMNADYYHVSSFYNIFNPDNANNFSGWTNPEYSKLYYQAMDAKTDSERNNIYEKLNKILQDEVPVVPILLSGRFILKNPLLGGFNGTLPFTYMRDYYIMEKPGCNHPLMKVKDCPNR